MTAPPLPILTTWMTKINDGMSSFVGGKPGYTLPHLQAAHCEAQIFKERLFGTAAALTKRCSQFSVTEK